MYTSEMRRRHGENVKTARDEAEISQTTLAELAGTSQQVISRLEKGMQGASDSLRVRIARALNVDPAELFPYYTDEVIGS